MVLLSSLLPAQSTGKASPPLCSWEPPTHPQGQVTFETAQAQINSAGLQDNRLLEPREKCAICNFLPPELGIHLIWEPQANPFSSLHLSFPIHTALQSLTHTSKRHCRNAESHWAEWQDRGQTDMIASDFLKMVIYSFSHCFRSTEKT